MQHPTENEAIQIGKLLGRAQAFGFTANSSFALQAEQLRQIRDSGAYKTIGNWDHFCETEVGISRQRVDEIIQSLEEFGAVYHKLREIIRISPEGFRDIQDNIRAEAIEIDGHSITISPENAPAIRDAVSRLRENLRKTAADLARSKKETSKAVGEIDLLTSPAVASLQTRTDSLADDIRRVVLRGVDSDAAAARGIVSYAAKLFADMERGFGS